MERFFFVFVSFALFYVFLLLSFFVLRLLLYVAICLCARLGPVNVTLM